MTNPSKANLVLNEKPFLSNPVLRYKNNYFEVFETKADFGSHQKEYFSINFGKRVGVVVCQNGSLLMVRQYRLFLNKKSWEIPGGQIHREETSVEAAMRECYEESGFVPQNPRVLLSYNIGHEGVNNPTDIFYSEKCDFDKDWEQESSETQEIHWIKLQKCLTMIEKGEINDSLSIIAILAYQEKSSRKI